MVEPVSITFGILYAGLGSVLWEAAKAGATGYVGNRADALVCRVGRSLHGRLLARRGLSENHDIAKGLRQAQLKAISFVIESWDRRRSENRPVAFLAGVRHGVKEAEKAVDDLAWNADIEAAMFASYQQAFREPQDDDDPNLDMARLAEETTQAAWDEVMAWAGGAHADDMLKPRFFGTMSHIVGFHDAWCAEVAEVLKDNSRFNDIFVAGKLVEIGDVVISGQDALARLEAGTAGAREQITDLRSWLEGQLSDLGDKVERGNDLSAENNAILRKLLGRAEADGRPLGPEATEAAVTTLEEVAASTDADLAGARQALDDQDPMALIDGLEAAAVSDALHRLRQAASIAYAIDVGRALRIYGRIAALDPDDVWTHIFLSRLHRTAGNLPAARAAAEAALAAVTEPRDRSCALNDLGDIAVAQGDLAGARRAYQDDLAIAEDLSGRDPGNTEWLRDLSVSHDRLGDIARAEGDLAGARKAYQDSLAIRQDLSGRDPGNTQWLDDLANSQFRLACLAEAEGDLAAAREAFLEAERSYREVLERSPTQAEARRWAEVAAAEAARLAD